MCAEHSPLRSETPLQLAQGDPTEARSRIHFTPYRCEGRGAGFAGGAAGADIITILLYLISVMAVAVNCHSPL
jgi:hypothetical protein